MALLLEVGFNEGTGTTAADSSGNGYDLTIPAGAWTPSGHTAGGLAQTSAGGSARANLGTGSAAGWTRMAWVYRTGTATDMVICECDQLVLFVNPSGQVGVWSGRLSQVLFTDDPLVPLNTWVHVSITHSGTNAVWVQVNGLGVASGVADHGAMSRTAPVYVGIDSDGLGYGMGIIDDLRIFDTLLSDEDVAGWMDTPVGGGSSGQDYDATPSDSLGLADAVTATITSGLTVTPTDSLGISDGLTVEAARVRSIHLADALGITDTDTSQSIGYGLDLDDTLDLDDSTETIASGVRGPGDTVGLTDHVDAVLTSSGSIQVEDPLGIADLLDATAQILREAADRLGISDTVTATLTAADEQAIGDTLALTDTLTVDLTSAGTAHLTETLGIGDTLLLTRDVTVTIDDQIGLTDTAATAGDMVTDDITVRLVAEHTSSMTLVEHTSTITIRERG